MPPLLESDVDAVQNLENWRKDKVVDMTKYQRRGIDLLSNTAKRLSVISQISKIVLLFVY